MLIDSHCHIYLEEFDSDREAVIQRSLEAGVGLMLLPNVDVSTLPRLFQMVEAHADLFPYMIGLHPTSVGKNYRSDLAQIEKILQESSPCAIGEIGLDLYWDKTYLKEQIDVLSTQLRWAIDLDLPVSLHVRNAFKEVRSIIDSLESKEKLRGVFHCFSGDKDDLNWVQQHPCLYIGFTGNITYRRNYIDVEFLKGFPLDRILIETDCPYLAPMPHRGKRNEPSFLPLTAHCVANLLGIENLDDAYTLFVQNTRKLFRI